MFRKNKKNNHSEKSEIIKVDFSPEAVQIINKKNKKRLYQKIALFAGLTIVLLSSISVSIYEPVKDMFTKKHPANNLPWTQNSALVPLNPSSLIAPNDPEGYWVKHAVADENRLIATLNLKQGSMIYFYRAEYERSEQTRIKQHQEHAKDEFTNHYYYFYIVTEPASPEFWLNLYAYSPKTDSFIAHERLPKVENPSVLPHFSEVAILYTTLSPIVYAWDLVH